MIVGQGITDYSAATPMETSTDFYVVNDPRGGVEITTVAFVLRAAAYGVGSVAMRVATAQSPDSTSQTILYYTFSSAPATYLVTNLGLFLQNGDVIRFVSNADSGSPAGTSSVSVTLIGR